LDLEVDECRQSLGWCCAGQRPTGVSKKKRYEKKTNRSSSSSKPFHGKRGYGIQFAWQKIVAFQGDQRPNHQTREENRDIASVLGQIS
jgi:hypothetical protein